LLLTHYYHKNDPPFQTLSVLSGPEALQVMFDLRERPGAVYRRFQDPKRYLRQRREVEHWVRQEFIHKGGRPITDYPQYFVVNESLWIEEGFQGQSRSVQFPLSAFEPEQISFTYPDSMISYWLRSQTDRVFYHPEYHGQVFNLNEIFEVIDRFGIPKAEWRSEAARKHDLFIEAQVWANIPD
jgi:hypothetical protein